MAIHEADTVGADGDLLDAGLAAAFGTTPPVAVGESVVRCLEEIPRAAAPLAGEADLGRAGRYEVRDEIGRGGSGVVFAGRDLDLDRGVALKVLRPDHLGSRDAERRFLHEARIVSLLEHPGIPPVYDVGTVRGNVPYFAMALLRGRSLAVLLDARRSPGDDLTRFLRLFEQVCQTVAHAHGRGVVHRDLKPSNVIVGAYGEVYVLDWGLARVGAGAAPRTSARPGPPAGGSEDVGFRVSAEGTALGTPAYLPPEQARGDLARVTERSDVFALGGMLLEILTGLPPHVGTTMEALRHAARGDCSDATARLDACAADAGLAALARACLAADPADRPPDAAAVARVVGERLAADEERSWRATLDAARERGRREAEEERERALACRARCERLARRLTLGMVGSLVLAAALGGGFLLHRQASETSRAGAVATAVHTALEQASRAEGAGDGATSEAWARRAVERARDGGAPAGTVRRAEAALARATEALAEARDRDRDARLLDLLDRADDAFDTDLDRRAAEAAYARAFAARGVAVPDASPERVAETFRRTRARSDVAAALETWAWLRRGRRGATESEWEPLREAARRLAPDPWREALLRAVFAGDRAALRAAAATDHEVPARTLHLVRETLSLREQQDLARPVLLAAWRRHPSDPRLNELLCVAFGGWTSPVQLGDRAALDPREAVRFALAYVALRPQDAHAWSLLGTAYDAAGEGVLAEAACRRALEATAADPCDDHAGALAGVLAHRGRDAEAVGVYRAALASRPYDGGLSLGLGTALRRVGRLAESLEVLDLGLAHDATDAPLLAARGATLAAMGRTAEAEAAYRAAVERNRRLLPAWHDLGVLLRAQGRSQEAVAALREALDAVPGQPSLLRELGLLLLDLGRPEEAVEPLRRAAEARPDDAESLLALARALAALGEAARR